MKKSIRLFVGILALAMLICWVLLIWSMKDWRGPMAGAGDNAVNAPESAGEQMFGAIIIGMIMLLPASPYLCMAAGAFNLIAGKLLQIACVYSLVVLVLMTLILIALGTVQEKLEIIAFTNIVLGVFWAHSGRPQIGTDDRSE